MHTEGQEVHETTTDARAGSTPGVVRWVLAISLLAAIVLLSIVWMTGAATTDEADREANVTDRVENASNDDGTDSIVSDDPSLVAPGGATAPAATETPATGSTAE